MTPDPTPSEIVTALYRQVLDAQDGRVWVGSRTNLAESPIELRTALSDQLVEQGLLARTPPGGGTTYYWLTAAGVRLAQQTVASEPFNVKALVEDTLDTILFQPSDLLDEETAIPWVYVPGQSRLVLVLGENAGGKSLFRRLIYLKTHRGAKPQHGNQEIPRGPFPVREMLRLSMEGRTGGGMSSSLIYGDEDYRSTGENSATTVLTAIRTVQGRGDTTLLYWDEPDVGMSNSVAAGAGIAIREFVEGDAAPLTQAVFVTSHNPALVRQLLPARPHYIYLGDAAGPPTIEAWLAAQDDPAPVSLETLRERSRARFHRIQKVLGG